MNRRRLVSAAVLALLITAPGCFLFRGLRPAEPAPEPAPAPAPHVAEPSNYTFPDAQAPLSYAVDHWNTHKGDQLRIDKVQFEADQWNMVRTNAGIIVRRNVPVTIYTEDPAGAACVIAWCALTQNEEGGEWSDGHLVCNLVRDATCESVANLDGVASVGASAGAI